MRLRVSMCVISSGTANGYRKSIVSRQAFDTFIVSHQMSAQDNQSEPLMYCEDLDLNVNERGIVEQHRVLQRGSDPIS